MSDRPVGVLTPPFEVEGPVVILDMPSVASTVPFFYEDGPGGTGGPAEVTNIPDVSFVVGSGVFAPPSGSSMSVFRLAIFRIVLCLFFFVFRQTDLSPTLFFSVVVGKVPVRLLTHFNRKYLSGR